MRQASASAQAMLRVATGADQLLPFQTGSFRVQTTLILREAWADKLLDARMRIAISVTLPKVRVSGR